MGIEHTKRNIVLFFAEETWKESKAENEEPGTLRGLYSPVEFLCFCVL